MAKRKLNMPGEYSHMSAHLNSSPRRKKLRQALQLAETTQSTEELTAQEKEVKEPTEITAWTGKLPKALHKLTGSPLNEETINVLTKPECFAIMVFHLAVGYSNTCKSDKKPRVVAAFLEEARRRNWTPPAAVNSRFCSCPCENRNRRFCSV
jgi:hypothetical protein